MKDTSKGRMPENAPLRESVPGSSSKDEHTQKPPPQQEAVKGTLKSEKPEKATKEESVQGSTKDKESTKPRPEQPLKEEEALGTSKGKKPHKSAPGAPKRKQSIQLPPGKTKNCMEYPKHFPLHLLGSYEPLEDTDSDPKNLLPSLSEKAKGKQPAPRTTPSYKRPSVSILRIPVARDGPLTRVKVWLRGDTATHHWQTFFFKNIVCLEPFWGETNDKAFVATRIVRLILTDGNPTPYFLMVCIGEHPRITSPRNDNEIFKGMQVPIYNDAFVFKLGEPELGVAGYANYVNFDKDVDGIDWLGHAIRIAAEKVEFAMARHANPGFPDMSNYADEETMSKDVGDMLSVMAMINKTRMKQAAAAAATTAVDSVNEACGLPDLERMSDTMDEMLKKARSWNDEGLLSFEGAVKSSHFQITDAFGQRTRNFFAAVEEALIAIKLDQTSSTSTDVNPPSVKTKALCRRARECFIIAEAAFESVKVLVTEGFHNKSPDVSKIRNANAEYDTNLLESMVNSVIVEIIAKKKDRGVAAARKLGDPYAKKLDLLGVKAQAAAQALEERKPYDEILQIVTGMNELSRQLREKIVW